LFTLVALPLAFAFAGIAVSVMTVFYGSVWLGQILANFLADHAEDFE
jgi:hypothetical protein